MLHTECICITVSTIVFGFESLRWQASMHLVDEVEMTHNKKVQMHMNTIYVQGLLKIVLIGINYISQYSPSMPKIPVIDLDYRQNNFND